jgi:NADH-quinone oxidoreductase subunit A
MSLAIYCFLVILVVMVMLSSYFLGERGFGPGRTEPYESGIKGYDGTNVRFFAQYFVLAILFVIFDVESVFLYVWSVSVREVGFQGFFAMLFFIGMLILALIYAIRLGVLNLVRAQKTRDLL